MVSITFLWDARGSALTVSLLIATVGGILLTAGPWHNTSSLNYTTCIHHPKPVLGRARTPTGLGRRATVEWATCSVGAAQQRPREDVDHPARHCCTAGCWSGGIGGHRDHQQPWLGDPRQSPESGIASMSVVPPCRGGPGGGWFPPSWWVRAIRGGSAATEGSTQISKT